MITTIATWLLAHPRIALFGILGLILAGAIGVIYFEKARITALKADVVEWKAKEATCQEEKKTANVRTEIRTRTLTKIQYIDRLEAPHEDATPESDSRDPILAALNSMYPADDNSKAGTAGPADVLPR